MNKFTFKEQKDLLLPQTGTQVAFKDKDGKPLSGEELLRRMAVAAEKWEQTEHKPVPIPEQKFIAWLKQGKKCLDEGMSSEEYFEKTLIKGGVL